MPFHSKRLTRSQRSFFLRIVILKKKIDFFCNFQFFDHVIQKKLNQPNKSLRKPEPQYYINFAQNFISVTSFQTSSCVPYAFDKNGQKNFFFFCISKCTIFTLHVACAQLFFFLFCACCFSICLCFCVFLLDFFRLSQTNQQKGSCKET